VIDDGSTDNTGNIATQIAGMDCRVKVFSQDNQKQGAARNRGMKIASGKYIGFVDSDDWVSFEYFEKLFTAALKHDADIALASNVRIGNGKTKKRLHIESEVFVQSFQDRIDISRQAKNPCPTNKIYRRELLINNNIFYPEGIYCEDKLFTMQALYYADSLVAVPETYYYYYRNPHSTVHSKSKALIRNKNAANTSVLNFLKSKNAVIRDGDFWAVLTEIRIFGVVILRFEESLCSRRLSLFGLKFLRLLSGGTR
jgi:glycosyltransferase involved in cell wall biosynthesis